MSIIAAFCTVLIVLLIGEIISTKTKALVPSVFVSAILFLVGFWTVFPSDLINRSGLGMPTALLTMYLLITHMGTIMSIRDLMAQWRTIVVSLAGLAGMCLFTLTIGKIFFDWQTILVGVPPLTGGVVASIIMSDAASNKGLTELAVLSVSMYAIKGFVGYPLTAFCLKKESARLLTLFRKGELTVNSDAKQGNDGEKSQGSWCIFPPVPPQYQSTYLYLTKLGLVAWAAVATAEVTHEIISKFVVCLIFGVIASEIGFLERKPLNLSGSFGWLITGLMAFIFSSLAKATPQMLLQMLVPLAGLIMLGTMGMAVMSVIVGKFLGYTKEMALSVALNAYYGFPPNYVLTEESANVLAKTPEEKEFLISKNLPQMLIGGFTSVTVVSVIIAGIFAKWL